MAPAIFQDDIYDEGAFLAADQRGFLVDPWFMDAYTALQNLSSRTNIIDEEKNTFLLMCNDTSHNQTILPLPDYDISDPNNNNKYDIAADKIVDGKTLHFDRTDIEVNVGQYHVCMAAMLSVGKWLDYLREEGVYDNTRIILVADHGSQLGQFDYMLLSNGLDVEAVNPLLMVKDFGDREFRISMDFMTNADVPAIATQNLFQHPINPFTGCAISMDDKKYGADIIWATDWDTSTNNGCVFQPLDAPWYRVKDNIFDGSNWERIK